MARDPKGDWYWPLGSLQYQHEIRDNFSGEAELLGVITILWNRQELALRRIFQRLTASPRSDYMLAIWDRQPTHQARRDLLALALQTVKMTKRQSALLAFIIDKTKTMADRRNELLHAEYVVHARTDQLHAKVKSPRSSKPPKHQKATTTDLQQVVNDLEQLLIATESAWLDFLNRADKRIIAQLERLVAEHEPSLENLRTGSDLPSLRRTHGEEY